ncbi:MAG: hypothetical protein IJD60_08450 [Clostridia bacterium]|nr:hypothetical protein [Clostridia bacterium]
MNGHNVKTKLLLTGMGFFLFAAAATLINALLLPYAYRRFGYPRLVVLACFVLAAAGFAALGRALARTEEERLERFVRRAVPAFLGVLFAAQVLIGYLLEYTPAGDNFMLFNGSRMLALEGDFSNYPDFGLYLARFSNQWGFLLMMTGAFRLLAALGVTRFFMAFVVILAALHSVGFASLLSIARRIRGARGQVMMMAVMALCLPLWLCASVLYTDTFSMPFVILALDFALRAAQAEDGKRQIGFALACGISALVGGQIKMTVAIVLMAAVIVWALSMRPLRAALCALLCAALMLSGGQIVRRTMLAHVIDPQVHAQQHTPTIHWIMMAIPTGDNPYGLNTGDYGITWGMMDEGATREEVMDSILTRMKDRIYTLRYPDRLAAAAFSKNASALCDGTFGLSEMLDDKPVRENALSALVLEGRRLYPYYGALCTGIYMAHMLFALLGCLRDIRARDASLSLAYIAMFGMMLFLMIWEARSRYLLSFVPVLLLLSCALLSRMPGRKENEE